MNRLVAGALTLEPQVAAHAAEMFTVLRDPALYEFENEPPQTLSELEQSFAAREGRRSPNGRERWLDWVVRLEGVGLIGSVQASIDARGSAAIAYELHSAYWGRGLARRAVEAMIAELVGQHGVRRLTAVLKQRNQRSLRLLQRLGFTLATPAEHARHEVERDEFLMQRPA